MTDFHARQGVVAPHPHPRRPETPSLINTGCEGSAVQLLRRLVVVRVTETMGVRMLFTLVLVSGVICGTCGKIFSEKGVEGTNTDEAQAINFLRQYDVEASVMCNRFMEASWDFNTNVTSVNRRRMRLSLWPFVTTLCVSVLLAYMGFYIKRCECINLFVEMSKRLVASTRTFFVLERGR
ncbi:putative angiotensin-converting enzyme-like [Penaeus vannamei]|uniref:Putative angiotensin-converting enzyme-like n=1 Tax=Penaeus vannamei TaxID=6689 RepID=A0A3R7SUW7_PENVA|nr:putative angiotensin-converting enzyme-like [Penaeus vannamei]